MPINHLAFPSPLSHFQRSHFALASSTCRIPLGLSVAVPPTQLSTTINRFNLAPQLRPASTYISVNVPAGQNSIPPHSIKMPTSTISSTSASASAATSPTSASAPSPKSSTAPGTAAAPTNPDVTTYAGALSYWWSSLMTKDSSLLAQDRVLRRGLGSIPLRHENDPDLLSSSSSDSSEERTATLRTVKLDSDEFGKGKDRYLNVLEVGRGKGLGLREGEVPVLVLHGYGGGLGFWVKNFEEMTSVPNTRVYYVDLPGMGRSGRSKFPSIPKGDPLNQADNHRRTATAEKWFVDALETLRQTMGIDRFILAGHSLGGYLSVSYALAHPSRVTRLMLISPAGVPAPSPRKTAAPEGEGTEEALEREFQTQQIDAAMGAGATAEQRAAEGEGLNAKEEEVKKRELAGRKMSTERGNEGPKTFKEKSWHWLWENVSPFSIIRSTSFLGTRLVATYASNRFHSLPSAEQYELFDYLYHICRERGSGEYAMNHILGFGARARWPIVERVEGVKVPINAFYGSHDWMDPEGARACLKILGEKGTPEQKEKSKVHLIDRAGHWLFLDNPAMFNRYFKRDLQDAVKDFKRDGQKAVQGAGQ